MNIPNLLSLFRILLIPCFVISYFTTQNNNVAWLPAIIIFISGTTDFLDGFIARKYNMITKLGKILDPIADKLTQIIVVGCLSVNHWEFRVLLIVYFIKELSMLMGSLWFIRKFNLVKVSRWFGKIATVEFYVAILLVILFPNMPSGIFELLVLLTISLSIYAFVRYIIEFLRVKHIK